MDNDIKLLTKTLGKNIRLHRKALGLSQEALAERVGIGHQALSRMERGEIAPKLERLQLFATALHCRIVDLFEMPDRPLTPSSVAIEELMYPLNDTQRALVLKQLTVLTEFFASNDAE